MMDLAIKRMEKNLDFLYEKIAGIQQRAEEKPRPLTENEQNAIHELQAEIDSLEFALDYLREYAE